MDRFIISRPDGQPIEPEWRIVVLDLMDDPLARNCLRLYADTLFLKGTANDRRKATELKDHIEQANEIAKRRAQDRDPEPPGRG